MTKNEIREKLYPTHNFDFGDDYDIFSDEPHPGYVALLNSVTEFFVENIDEITECIRNEFTKQDLSILMQADLREIVARTQSRAFIDAMRSVMNKSVFKDEVERWNVEIPIDAAEEEILDNIPDEEFTVDKLRAKLEVIYEKMTHYAPEDDLDEPFEWAVNALVRNAESFAEYVKTCTPHEYNVYRWALGHVTDKLGLNDVREVITQRDEELFAPDTWVLKEDYEDDD